MVFHNLGKFQGTVKPENFFLVAYCVPPGFGRDRVQRCYEFFVDGYSQSVVGKRWHISQSSVRHDCISLLAYWALDAKVFGELWKKPSVGGSGGSDDVPTPDSDT